MRISSAISSIHNCIAFETLLGSAVLISNAPCLLTRRCRNMDCQWLSVEDELFLFETFLKLSSENYSEQEEMIFSEDESDVPLIDYFVNHDGKWGLNSWVEGWGSVMPSWYAPYSLIKKPSIKPKLIYNISSLFACLKLFAIILIESYAANSLLRRGSLGGGGEG